MGQRHRDIKNGLSAPPKPTLLNLLDLATKPRWCLNMLGTPRRKFGNIFGHVKGIDDMSSLGEWTNGQFDPTLNWNDVEWVKKRWGGKLILKGIQDAEDARLAVASGADALIVSNHGGRQLDGAASSINALPGIVQAVGKGIEVHMDGGVRSGQDVLKARALGAQGTYIGRAMFRETPESATVALSLSTANGGVVISAAGGLVTLSASAASMSAITAGRYVYDLEIESSTGSVKRLVEGVAKVSREVTR
jgi:isopentenyl diphosphate isomerase/L-lactate dehydrogenase-like FMN-dependent dehydrogenase